MAGGAVPAAPAAPAADAGRGEHVLRGAHRHLAAAPRAHAHAAAAGAALHGLPSPPHPASAEHTSPHTLDTSLEHFRRHIHSRVKRLRREGLCIRHDLHRSSWEWDIVSKWFNFRVSAPWLHMRLLGAVGELGDRAAADLPHDRRLRRRRLRDHHDSATGELTPGSTLADSEVRVQNGIFKNEFTSRTGSLRKVLETR